jgi:hypothetical protein
LLPESFAAVAGAGPGVPQFSATSRPGPRPFARPAARPNIAIAGLLSRFSSLSTSLSTVVNDGWSRLVTGCGGWNLWCEGLTLTSPGRALQAVIHRLWMPNWGQPPACRVDAGA